MNAEPLTLEKLEALVRESEADPLNQAIGGALYLHVDPDLPKGWKKLVGRTAWALVDPNGNAEVFPFAAPEIARKEPEPLPEWSPDKAARLRALFSNTAKRSDEIAVRDRVKCSRSLMRTGAGFEGFGVVEEIKGKIYFVRLEDGSVERVIRGNLVLARKTETE